MISLTAYFILTAISTSATYATKDTFYIYYAIFFFFVASLCVESCESTTKSPFYDSSW